MRRRTFLKTSILASALPASASESSSSNACVIENGKLRLQFDLNRGLVTLETLPGNRPLLVNATAAVLFPKNYLAISDSRYARRAERKASDEPGIEGQQLAVHCSDAQRKVDLEYRIILPEGRAAAVFELVLTNVSDQPLVVPAAEPLRALLDETSGCGFGYSRKVLVNGFMCYDAGDLLDFGWTAGRDVVSWWNAAFLGSGGSTLVVGYLENRDAAGQIFARCERVRQWQPGGNLFDLTARSTYSRDFVVKPGGSISTGRVLFQVTPGPFEGLDSYAETAGRLQRVKLNPIVNGWCSWFYTRRIATEDEQLKNARFVAEHLKPYGIEWIQLDAGWQKAFGQWEANHLYPHGMKWLAQKIRALGLKPGIWIAPFEITAGTEVAREHPEWLVRDRQGNIAGWPEPYADWISPTSHALDITHPGAQKWLFDLFKMIADDWGYEMVKIDRVEPTLLAAPRYFDPSVSKAQAYRRGIEIIRRAIGPTRHLLDSGPMALTVGLIDSARIEADVPPLNWRQYARRPNSVAPAAARRYYFHNRTWINDADHLGIAQMSLVQGRAAASIVALSGGTMILGDRLVQLDPERLEILKKVLPSFGQAARPLDLFENSYPEIFSLPIRRDFGDWWVVGYFNWSDDAAQRELSLRRLGLPAGKNYLVYDFWEQRLLGEFVDKLPLTLEPTSVKLLGIRAHADVPQVLATDRHFTQGGIELESVRWDAATCTLAGTARGSAGFPWTLAIFVPAGYVWEGKGAGFYQWHDAPGVLAVAHQDDPRVIRAQLSFPASNRLDWSFRFRRE